jgi:hypothetical protein
VALAAGAQSGPEYAVVVEKEMIMMMMMMMMMIRHSGNMQGTFREHCFSLANLGGGGREGDHDDDDDDDDSTLFRERSVNIQGTLLLFGQLGRWWLR